MITNKFMFFCGATGNFFLCAAFISRTGVLLGFVAYLRFPALQMPS